jgi:hypothetical protein
MKSLLHQLLNRFPENFQDAQEEQHDETSEKIKELEAQKEQYEQTMKELAQSGNYIEAGKKQAEVEAIVVQITELQ